MIKYKLICKKCEKTFDSWFASSKEYEKLKNLNHLDCHNCSSFKVEKTLMSPNVLNSKDKIGKTTKPNTFKISTGHLKKLTKFIAQY